ncbi:hypothetical protein BDZ89DRAFT_60102 [Hymenopellis radicata]|nr:hypothetical protein BDZ89DRAFT_60102 [Hymenopellis radicata]
MIAKRGRGRPPRKDYVDDHLRRTGIPASEPRGHQSGLPARRRLVLRQLPERRRLPERQIPTSSRPATPRLACSVSHLRSLMFLSFCLAPPCRTRQLQERPGDSEPDDTATTTTTARQRSSPTYYESNGLATTSTMATTITHDSTAKPQRLTTRPIHCKYSEHNTMIRPPRCADITTRW